MIRIYLPESNVKVTIIVETITPPPPPSSSPPPSVPPMSKVIQFPDSTEFTEGRAYAQ